jgi:hypothetical protein
MYTNTNTNLATVAGRALVPSEVAFPHRSRSATLSKLRSLFLRQGFVFFRAAEIGLPSQLTKAQIELINEAKLLPVDRYAKHPNRFRCLHHTVYTPWNNRLNFLPGSVDPVTGEEYVAYKQGDENPDHSNQVRRFGPMPTRMQKNRALRDLVRRDFALTPFAAAWDKWNRTAFAVTFHVIRHNVQPGETAASSPDLVHTDGVLLSFVHVIERSFVNGGVNAITKVEHDGTPYTKVPIKDLLAVATVDGVFDGYGFIDRRVGHYVSPVEPALPDREGARTILIIDFAPMTPVLRLTSSEDEILERRHQESDQEIHFEGGAKARLGQGRLQVRARATAGGPPP